MKTTTISYCQVCTADFEDGQIAFYVPIDNNIVCRKCAEESRSEVRERLVTR